MNSVLVTVCTYRRPDDLRLLLDSAVRALDRCAADLLVVDNDPDGSARRTVEQHAPSATYVLCTAPGIAQARNAALEHRGPYEWIVFIDDDEVVHEDWLTELVGGAERHDCDIATGPVISRYPNDAPRWIVRGRFMQRARHPSGTPVEFAATNNLIVRTSALDRLQSPWFDVAFSRSGGSDSELIWRLRRVGASVVWIDTAVVEEAVPAGRLSARWVGKRLLRGGNVHGRLLLREMTRNQVKWYGAKMVLRGLATTLLSLVTSKGLRAPDVVMWVHGLGVMKAGTGSIVYEYNRG